MFYNKKNTKINKIILCFVLLFAFCVNISFSEASVEKRNVKSFTYSKTEEMVLGEHMKNLIPYKKDNNGNITHIFNEIVRANPENLYLNDGENDWHLNSPTVIDDSSMVNAMTTPGGNVMISKGLINLVNMKEDIYEENKIKETGNYLRNNNPNNIYNNSSIGFYLAHEMAHWYNRDWVYMSSLNDDNKENIGMTKSILFKGNPNNLTENELATYISKIGTNNNKLDNVNLELEKLADKNGCFFISNTEQMSVGSAIYGFWKARKNLGIIDTDESNSSVHMEGGKHPSTLLREKLIYEEYIRKPLGNRINFDFNSRILLIDGEKWFSNGYGLGTKEVSPSERTWYYIGQIASLKNVMNNHKNSDIKSLNVVERPIAFLNNKINNNQTLIYIKLDYKNGDSYTKLIDKFDIDYNRVATLLSYKTSPINNEEKYFFYELSYLKKLLQN